MNAYRNSCEILKTRSLLFAVLLTLVTSLGISTQNASAADPLSDVGQTITSTESSAEQDLGGGVIDAEDAATDAALNEADEIGNMIVNVRPDTINNPACKLDMPCNRFSIFNPFKALSSAGVAIAKAGVAVVRGAKQEVNVTVKRAGKVVGVVTCTFAGGLVVAAGSATANPFVVVGGVTATSICNGAVEAFF